MSHLLVVTQPALVPGYQLAGVEAFAVRDSAEAQQLITKWPWMNGSGPIIFD